MADNDQYMIYDERRQRIHFSRHLTSLQKRLYQDNQTLINHRTDMNILDQQRFFQTLMLGESYLNLLKKKLDKELQRVDKHLKPGYMKEQQQNFYKQFSQLSVPFILGQRFNTTRSREETHALVNYVDLIRMKVQKWGLDYPQLNNRFTKQQCIDKENQLAKQFYKEMTKKVIQ